jgi:hypothetical protein
MEKTFFRFLEERFEGLKTANLETLERLTEILLRKKPTVTEGNLLLRMSNLLAEKPPDGESRVHALREKIMNHLIRYKQRIGRGGSR